MQLGFGEYGEGSGNRNRFAAIVALVLSIAACSGETTSGGGRGGSAGSSATCDELKSDYSNQLTLAKKCDLFATPGTQCSVSVEREFVCGCPTRVEASNAEAVAALDSIQKQWQAQGCPDDQPPCAADCAMPSGATCEAGGQGGDTGVCTDVY